MDLDLRKTLDTMRDGVKETAEVVHVKTNKFHENYVSDIIPDMGKYGEAAKFVVEMVPGVAEYNAIKDGDWQTFAIAAGIDVAAIAAGAFTAGAGYAVVKTGIKAGTKVVTKEVAEAATKKAVKEVAEAGAEKAVKEVAEAGTEKVTKETAESGIEKIINDGSEKGIHHIEYYTDEIDRINQSPKKGFDGLRGDSRCYPDIETESGRKAAEKMAEYGQDYVRYEKGVVDFSPFSELTVRIDMTPVRRSNFRKADDLVAIKWNKELRNGKTDWGVRDVEQWRHDNKYTWHERSDMKLCDLVPLEIHNTEVFPHCGGIAEFNKKFNLIQGGLFDA